MDRFLLFSRRYLQRKCYEKKILLFIAAMLFSTATAFAQGGTTGQLSEIRILTKNGY